MGDLDFTNCTNPEQLFTPEGEYTALTQVVAMALILIEEREITPQNWLRVAAKVKMAQDVWGNSLATIEPDGEHHLDAIDIKRYIGIKVNRASKGSDSGFLKRVFYSNVKGIADKMNVKMNHDTLEAF